PRELRPTPDARFNIARTMFETDRLPEGAPERLNTFDRIWVPSRFNQETFIRSGVDPTKIAVVPGAIDPAYLEEAPLPDDWSWIRDAYVRTLLEARAVALPEGRTPNAERRPRLFLSIFDWTLHKGWDALLEAFALEFGR